MSGFSSTLTGNNESIGSETRNVTLSLTNDQLSQLMTIMNVSKNSVQPAREDPTTQKKNASSWPEWDGSKELYPTFIIQLAAKIDTDWELLGGHKAVCMDMMNTIPKTLRTRISQWFSTGGPNGDWNYELFITHFNDNFEDKSSIRTANEKLTRMRQGQHQTFASYLNDFEHLLAQSGGLKWEGYVKINSLYLGLNEKLTNHLMLVSLSDTDYTLFVKEVRKIAGKLESREDFIPRNSAKWTRTWFISRFGNAPPTFEAPQQLHGSSSKAVVPRELDADGDVKMTDISGISTSTLAAIINAVNAHNEKKEKKKSSMPPAPWRSPEEFAALRAAGKCTRCAKKGHYFKKCPTFTWAARPSDVNLAHSVKKIPVSRILESDNEEDEIVSENE